MGTFLVELMVVRINWELSLAFVPITNDGNIYFGKEIYFLDTNLQFWYYNGSKNESPQQVADQYPILRRNNANCGAK